MILRSLLVLLLVLLSAWPASAARQFNGSSDYLVSASSLTLSGSPKLTIGFWLWWDSYANDFDVALEYGGTGVDGQFTIHPNDSRGTFSIYVNDSFVTVVGVEFTRPSAGAWHHYVYSIDRSLTAADQITGVWVDGAVPAGYNVFASSDVSSAWGDLPLYAMSRLGSSLFGAGRFGDVALYSGYNFLQADVDALYNHGVGAAATSVQNAHLAYYWGVCGTASPEPGTTGGISMTVTGTTHVTHPSDGGPCGTTGTIAASCTPDDIAIAVMHAADGATVTVPAGNCTWTNLTISNKAISLIGAGAGNTNITGGASLFTINTKASGGSPAGFFRLSGFQFTSTGGCSGTTDQGAWSFVQGTSANVRLDHNTWLSDVAVNCPVLNINNFGGLAGVADHNTFTINAQFAVPIAIFDYTGDSHGDDAWAAPDNMGAVAGAPAPNTFYFETNTVNNASGRFLATDAQRGARMVWRHNQISNMAIGNHGTESGGRDRGIRLTETYENDFTMDAVSDGTGGLASFRGGTGVVYNNRIHLRNGQTALLAQMNNFRRAGQQHPAHPWGPCGVVPATFTQSGGTATATAGTAVWTDDASNCGTFPFCQIVVAGTSNYNGTHQITAWVSTNAVQFSVGGSPGSEGGTFQQVWDGNTDATGYRCMDQVGSGPSIAFSDPLNNADVQPIAAASNTLSPVYCWGNTVETNGGAPSSTTCTSTSDSIVVGRDVITDGTVKPGYTALTYPHPLTQLSANPFTPRHFIIRHRP